MKIYDPNYKKARTSARTFKIILGQDDIDKD